MSRVKVRGNRQRISFGKYASEITQKEKESLLGVPEPSTFIFGEINTDVSP